MHDKLNLITIILESGIIVKLVMLILIFLSVLSWAIILQKFKELKKAKELDLKFNEDFYSGEVLNEIFEKSLKNESSPLSLMFQKGYLELNKIKERLHEQGGSLSLHFKENGFVSIERALKQGAYLSNEKFENRLSILASISSVAPFIGLFGTVWGIIDSFTGLASGGGSIEAVAPGIAEALVATAVGLAAAIPANWFYNVLSTQVASVNEKMENFGQEFLNIIERNVLTGKK